MKLPTSLLSFSLCAVMGYAAHLFGANSKPLPIAPPALRAAAIAIDANSQTICNPSDASTNLYIGESATNPGILVGAGNCFSFKGRSLPPVFLSTRDPKK